MPRILAFEVSMKVAVHLALGAVAFTLCACSHASLSNDAVGDRGRERALPFDPADTVPVIDVESADAALFPSPHACVAAAAARYRDDPDDGFARLVSCVGRDDFRDLELLVGAPWTAALRHRDEGPALIARVIAARGGNVDRDLRIVRRHGLPIVTLRAALAEPDERAGSLVIMRGSAVGWRSADDGGRAIEIAETRFLVDEDFLDERELVRRRTKSGAAIRDELTIETGQSVIVSVPASTVLEPSSDYVLLLRFDGDRDAFVGSATTVVRASVATVLGSYEAESNLVAWR